MAIPLRHTPASGGHGGNAEPLLRGLRSKRKRFARIHGARPHNAWNDIVILSLGAWFTRCLIRKLIGILRHSNRTETSFCHHLTFYPQPPEVQVVYVGRNMPPIGAHGSGYQLRGWLIVRLWRSGFGWSSDYQSMETRPPTNTASRRPGREHFIAALALEPSLRPWGVPAPVDP